MKIYYCMKANKKKDRIGTENFENFINSFP